MWQTRLLIALILVTRFAMPLWTGAGTWRYFEDGRWGWSALGAVATALLAAAAWRTAGLWRELRKTARPPAEQLATLFRLRHAVRTTDVA